VAAGELGLESETLINQLAKELCELQGFKEAAVEEVYDAVSARLLKLNKDVEEARKRRTEAVTGGGEQPMPTGPDLAAAAAGGPRPSVAATRRTWRVQGRISRRD
jgi:hypothetical protein